ncbi:unnamed protein product [Rangifer tarandus platyrhynchus]|uniref:Uncharacterized protein n=1 Tax=Rangifer tarandus platyrhynchus TaxID=3082113 RepID=A0ABN8ZND0_RANTA|nr:unnamed protein product [Rangifer tarandus platyrhynchus]
MKDFELNCVLPISWGRVAAGRQVEVTLCPGPGPEGGEGVLCSRPDPRQARSRVHQVRCVVGPRAVPSPHHSASRLTELCAHFSWYLPETVWSNETIQTGEVSKDTPTKLCALREDRSFVEVLRFFLVKSGVGAGHARICSYQCLADTETDQGTSFTSAPPPAPPPPSKGPESRAAGECAGSQAQDTGGWIERVLKVVTNRLFCTHLVCRCCVAYSVGLPSPTVRV